MSDALVTDNGDQTPRAVPLAADNRDCDECGREMRPDETVCIFDRHSNQPQDFKPSCEDCARQTIDEAARRRVRWWTSDGSELPDHMADPDADGYDPFAEEGWEAAPCVVCSRPVRGPTGRRHACCSEECKPKLAAAVTRERRRAARASEIPESFTCTECGKKIEGTVVFAAGGAQCEPCYTEQRREHDRAGLERNRGGPFECFYSDPDAPGWSPYRDWQEEAPCGHCGRSIRGRRFCCDRCDYEAGKAARRVSATEKFCVVCGEAFTPKRSDAVTCSDRCRQAKRRLGVVTDSRVARAPRAPADAPNRDITKRD